MEFLFEPETWIALLTLTALEIVLGVDNIIFISILTGKLPPAERAKGRTIGLAAAMGMRILLLFSLAWVIQLTEPIFSIFEKGISGRDLILFVGGLFLLAKATHEIHQRLEGAEGEKSSSARVSFGSVIFQIMLLDLVFSLDSVITAVGMAKRVEVMIAAVMIAVGVMMVFAKAIADFVEQHPTVKMLALSFLLLIGTALVADGLHFHIPKGYIYFAMGFSVFVEMLNLKLRKPRKKPVNLRQPYVEDQKPAS